MIDVPSIIHEIPKRFLTSQNLKSRPRFNKKRGFFQSIKIDKKQHRQSKLWPTDLSIPEVRGTSCLQESECCSTSSTTWVSAEDGVCPDRSRANNFRSRTKKSRIPNSRTASLGFLGCYFSSCLCAGKSIHDRRTREKIFQSTHNFRKRVIFSKSCAGMNDMLFHPSILWATKN